MIRISYLLTGLLCLLLSLPAIGQGVLQQKVSLSIKNASLQSALQELENQYGLQFSYLNNDLPPQAAISLTVKELRLEEVLDSLLASTSLGYTERRGQIIISKNLPKKEALPPGQGPVKEVQQPVQAPAQVPNEIEEESQPQQVPPAQEAPTLTAEVLRPEQEGQVYEPLAPPAGLYASIDRAIFSRLQTGVENEKKPFHWGLVYPLSNHGTEAGRYVNRLSLHLLVGYSAGLEGFEASGIGNIENDYVQGAQFSGYFNVVKHGVRGFQGSGFFNFAGDSLSGVQAGGFANFTRRHVHGAQLGGFGNVAGSMRGWQVAGFGNLAESVSGAQLSGFGGIASHVQGAQLSGFGSLASTVNGAQISGFGSLAKGVQGLQASGFGNIAQRVGGTQLAGFGNVAAEVDGLQASGFFNAAGRVKGVQLGFLNFADTVDGVSIGFLSLVRRGYHHPEVWTAEDFEANIAVKLGVRRFYNIFAASSDLQGERWALGYGIGSHWPLGARLYLNTDIISAHVVENSFSEGWPRDMELNLLNKFRLLAGWQFARHFSLFAGPTYAVMVSQHRNETGIIGSGLARNPFYNKTFDGRTNVQMWVGFNAGIRF